MMNIPKIDVNLRQIGNGIRNVGTGVITTAKGVYGIAKDALSKNTLTKDVFQKLKSIPCKKEIAVGTVFVAAVGTLAVACVNKIKNKVAETVNE